MTRLQRARHVRLWAVLGVILLALVGTALIVRERASEAISSARDAWRR